MQPAPRLCSNSDDDVEGIGALEPRGIVCRSHVRFGFGRPHGAVAVGDLSLDHAGSELALGGIVGDVDLAWIIAKRQKLISGTSDLGLQLSGEVASGGRGQKDGELLFQLSLFPRER